MKIRQPKTVHDLLLEAPAEEVSRLKLAWQETARGNWSEAAHFLRNASRNGDSDWHDECAVLAVEFDTKTKPQL